MQPSRVLENEIAIVRVRSLLSWWAEMSVDMSRGRTSIFSQVTNFGGLKEKV